MTQRLDYTNVAPAGVKALGGVYGYITQSRLPTQLVNGKRAAHPPSVGAGKIGPGNQRLSSLRQPLVGRQRLAVPFLWLAIAASQQCPRY
jgi:hypothetical protein